MSDILHHYCSLEVFHSIITTKKIRLSALSLSNDSMEGKLLGQLLTEEAEQDGKSPIKIQHLKRLVKYMNDYQGGFGLCLSKKEDSLSQWRGYADDGRGVCIGFNRDFLKDLQPAEPTPSINIDLAEVIYELDEQKTKIREFYSQIKPDLMRLDIPRLHFPQEKTDNNNSLIATQLFERVSKTHVDIAYRLKGKGFWEEEEIRMLTYLSPDNQSIKYHPKENKLVPYIELELSPNSGVISEVTYGPRNVSSYDVFANFLTANKLERINIKPSSISYQG